MPVQSMPRFSALLTIVSLALFLSDATTASPNVVTRSVLVEGNPASTIGAAYPGARRPEACRPEACRNMYPEVQETPTPSRETDGHPRGAGG